MGTGGQYGSDAFGPAATVYATNSLGDVAVGGYETDGLLGEVVGGFDLWCSDGLAFGFGMQARCLRYGRALRISSGTGRREPRAIRLNASPLAILQAVRRFGAAGSAF